MPQPGVHAVAAVAARRFYPRDAWFTLGVVFGALLPDIDVYAQGIAVLFAGMRPLEAYALFHNTMTHSLLSMAGLWLVLSLLSLLLQQPRLMRFGSGMALGMVLLHTLPDAILWFDGVGAFWPLYSLNIWNWLRAPDIISRLLLAGDFFAFYAYFIFLGELSRRNLTDRGYKIRLRQYSYLQLGLGVISTFLALFLPAAAFYIYYTYAYALIAFPNALWVTWRLRATIASPAVVRRKRPNNHALLVDKGS